MLLEELDGFIAGLLVCPNMIMPGEWLPVVWGTKEDDAAPAFDSLDHLNRVLSLVMEHYNDVAQTLMERPERYAPLFAFDRRNNDILGKSGSSASRRRSLRPAAWRALLDVDAETAQAISGLLMLADVDRRDRRFPKEQLDALSAVAPEKIGPWIVTLNEWRLANYQPPQDLGAPPSSARSTPTSKVGRNDPCPCGSGKK
jgi:uncharacterized protein